MGTCSHGSTRKQINLFIPNGVESVLHRSSAELGNSPNPDVIFYRDSKAKATGHCIAAGLQGDNNDSVPLSLDALPSLWPARRWNGV